MDEHLQMVCLAQDLGFRAVWLRDIPFDVPSFGDVGQIFDPLVYLGYLAAATDKINLGIASLILPLAHSANVAKAASSIDVLSKGRLILGVATGDRIQEYDAFGIDAQKRGELFRQSLAYLDKIYEKNPQIHSPLGNLNGELDLLPKPVAKKVPMLITGFSRQNKDFVAQNTNGLITYPRPPHIQERLIKDYRLRIKNASFPNKPVMQSLYIDLLKDKNAKPSPIHLGYKLGTNGLVKHLKLLQKVGINHVSINLRLNHQDTKDTLKRLSDEVLGHFMS